MCLVLAAALVGCAGDDDDETPACPGISSPALLELADVTPAPGSTLPNEDIVHAFTVTTPVAFDSIAFALSAAHTAGNPTPGFTFSLMLEGSGVVYTAEPLTWETAPAHVEFYSPVVYQTPDGCGYKLPSPLFSYDVTAP
jgi:hypothetical protein